MIELFNWLKDNKDGIEVGLDILQFLGYVIGGWLAIRLSYFAFAREIKFARIKQLIDDAFKLRIEISRDLQNFIVWLKEELMSDQTRIADLKSLKTMQEKIRPIFNKAKLANSDIANIAVLLDLTLNNVIFTLGEKRNITKTFEIVLQRTMLIWLERNLNLLNILCQKIETSPTVAMLKKPYRKSYEMNIGNYILTRSRRPLQSRFLELGVNLYQLRPEVLNYLNISIYAPNDIIPYAVSATGKWDRYLARSLYRRLEYFPIRILIKAKEPFKEVLPFILFKIEIRKDLFTGKVRKKIFYILDDNVMKFDSNYLFSCLEKEGSNFILRDAYMNSEFKVCEKDFSFSITYDQKPTIVFSVTPRNLKFYFFKNIFFIILDLFKKKSLSH
ncbi:hypothetical protein JWG44_15690 [Leptospira sp. 201903071]|uniref:hypothetical protein n=1 Tax=Leptospira ainazelensis TaxID=2810034 RepID=UPI0019667B35|nr:hypothetical protein [Leptospira ainazelensis]MBM9501697.1 hypothetical protein [Leptospira ainazelensis]